MDRADCTIAGGGKAKDTTPNVLSMLVFNGSITAEMLVSPAETNPYVKPYDSYEFDSPSGAANTTQATWDPKLSECLDGSRPGHVSYALPQMFQGLFVKAGETPAQFKAAWD